MIAPRSPIAVVSLKLEWRVGVQDTMNRKRADVNVALEQLLLSCLTEHETGSGTQLHKYEWDHARQLCGTCVKPG